MTKQEQRHQIIIAMIHQGYEIKSVAKIANDLMAEMYGKDWESQPEVEYIPGCGCQHAETFHPLIAEEKHDCPNFERVPIVSIAEQDGEKGVRLCVGDIDIFIEAHDLDEDGKEFKWDEAMKKLKAYGKRTFDKHEMYLIAAFKDEINAALREIGGAELASGYWSSTECGSYNAWLVYFSSGGINLNNQCNTSVVRPVAAFKHE